MIGGQKNVNLTLFLRGGEIDLSDSHLDCHVLSLESWGMKIAVSDGSNVPGTQFAETARMSVTFAITGVHGNESNCMLWTVRQ